MRGVGEQGVKRAGRRQEMRGEREEAVKRERRGREKDEGARHANPNHASLALSVMDRGFAPRELGLRGDEWPARFTLNTTRLHRKTFGFNPPRA